MQNVKLKMKNEEGGGSWDKGNAKCKIKNGGEKFGEMGYSMRVTSYTLRVTRYTFRVAHFVWCCIL